LLTFFTALISSHEVAGWQDRQSFAKFGFLTGPGYLGLPWFLLWCAIEQGMLCGVFV
jgi:hypothetical protein